MIEHVPPDLVVGLTGSPEIKVGERALPVMHFLALDGRNPALAQQVAAAWAIVRRRPQRTRSRIMS